MQPGFYNRISNVEGNESSSCLNTVIASAAKQSRLDPGDILDCFVAALHAMTEQVAEVRPTRRLS